MVVHETSRRIERILQIVLWDFVPHTIQLHTEYNTVIFTWDILTRIK